MGNLFTDIRRIIPDYEPNCVFDVGANVGQSVREIRRAFPEAPVFAFEPVTATFELLRDGTVDDRHLTPLNIALSDQESVVEMTAGPGSVVNRILAPGEKSRTRQEVRTTRGDTFMLSEGLPRIGILKIDTEGHDLAVLRGLSSALSIAAVDFIQVEAGLSPNNTRHVSATSFLSFLGVFGYSLFGIYDVSREKSGFPLLRRANLAFVSANFVGKAASNA